MAIWTMASAGLALETRNQDGGNEISPDCGYVAEDHREEEHHDDRLAHHHKIFTCMVPMTTWGQARTVMPAMARPRRFPGLQAFTDPGTPGNPGPCLLNAGRISVRLVLPSSP